MDDQEGKRPPRFRTPKTPVPQILEMSEESARKTGDMKNSVMAENNARVVKTVKTITVTNCCGGLMYLRGPGIGEIRLAHGDSFTETEALMPMGQVWKLVREGKFRVSEHLVDGD